VFIEVLNRPIDLVGRDPLERLTQILEERELRLFVHRGKDQVVYQGSSYVKARSSGGTYVPSQTTGPRVNR
jgi:hypothetical protein